MKVARNSKIFKLQAHIRVRIPATDTGYRYRLQIPATDTGYRHRLQTPATDTGYRHRMQTPDTDTPVGLIKIQGSSFLVDNANMSSYVQRFAIVLVLVICAVTGAWADTVFITLSIPTGDDGTAEVPEEVIATFEDGIMEPFFDAYHIVCNARDTTESPVSPADLQGNGIDVYLSVDLAFTPAEVGFGLLDSRCRAEYFSSGTLLVSCDYSSRTFEDPEKNGDGPYKLQGAATAEAVLDAMND